MAVAAEVHGDNPKAQGKEEGDLEGPVILVAGPAVDEEHRDSGHSFSEM